MPFTSPLIDADDGRLLEKVIDIEVQNHTPSPTVDPSVRTILIGHSVSNVGGGCSYPTPFQNQFNTNSVLL